MIYFGKVKEFKENTIHPEMKMKGREGRILYTLGFKGGWGWGGGVVPLSVSL